MADTPQRTPSRRRPHLAQGAWSGSAPFQTGVRLRPAEDRRLSRADPSLLRRFARRLMFRGERATHVGDFREAAFHFERAALGYETLGDPFPAAEATLELGRCLLFSRRGEWLPKLAGRLANLAREEAASLPPGGLVTLLVWASILRKGEAEPLALVQLIRARRRARSVPRTERPH